MLQLASQGWFVSGYFRVGAWLVKPSLNTISKNGTDVQVEPKVMEVLVCLATRAGESISKEIIIKTVWPDTFVSDDALIRCVSELRRVFGDDARTPSVIQTIPKRGYRLVASVEYTTDHSALPASPVEKLGTRHMKLWQVLVPVLAVLSAALIATGYHRSHAGRQINHKDTMVLADFVNTTGDTVFDGTLRQGLSVQLEQSPLLRIISDQQIQQTLAMMGQPANARLTSTITRELCQRTNSAALVDGSIAEIGMHYVLTLKAADCASGESLASSQAQARDKNHVLESLGKAAFDLRQKLGESLSSAREFDLPLERATTPSLEALQSYSFGRRQMMQKGEKFAAVPLFQRAIQLDPNFAMAYASLGTAYFDLGEHELGADNTRKAYELRERLSQRERFYIEAHYYDQVTGDVEKARQVYDLWARIFPKDFVPHDNSSEIYAQLGQYDRSLEEGRTALRLDPANGSHYADLALNYIYLNRLGDAEATIQQALANKLDSPNLHIRLYQVAFLRNDTAATLRQVPWGAGERGVEDVLLALEAETAAYAGRLTKARELSRRAIVSAQNAGEHETAATYEAFAALRESLMGNRLEARGRVVDALRLSTGREVQAVEALALAFSGDIPRSQTLANDLARNFPEDTIVQFNYIPTIRARLALDGGDARTAIATSEIVAAYELGDPVQGDVTAAMCPIFVRGQAYLMAGDGFESATEFQKVLEHPGVALNRLIGALAHLGLARAYRLQGDTSRARAAYRDFLTLWKDADPGIPVMKQATEEYNNLK